ncbi:sensor histidine kinase [Blastococcus sp. URHD0036]|uniref:sensor histidine kinase n=1 Tax=Blastococcus sp. URHD0036 TaxID=1380356 RepID=UPI00068BFEEB|nr:histidine kinase [Blastococcus sp. URHD0036]
MTAAAPRAAPSSPLPPRWVGGDDARPLGTSRIGWLWAAVWLVYLAVPVRTAWRHRDTFAGVVAVVALVVFAVGFAAYFAWMRAHRIRSGELHPGPVWAMLAVMVLLLVVAAPGAGEDVVAGAVYVGVTAAMTLPGRQVVAVAAALAAAAALLPRVVPGWESLDGFVPQLLLAVFAAYGVGQVLRRNIELAQARQQLVQLAVTEERERVARDVHDILGHSLTVITVKTELAGRLLEATGAGDSRARAELADAERLAREALADVRATVSGMRNLSLPGELAAARSALDAAGIAGELPSAVDDVPSRYRELFAFALREGVTNVVRHSGAGRCVVSLAADRLEVRDDGRGPGGGSGGSGLAGLRERAAAVGARVETGRAPEGGFLLRVVRA